MKKSQSLFLLLIAFISGLSIMAMEISASRLLAPYFGTSLFVWTNIIGIVLIALSLGYYIGGKLADKYPKLNILLKLILLAGILFLIIPWLIKPIILSVDTSTLATQSASIGIFIYSLIVTIVLFSLPIFLLGMVSPFVIKLYSLQANDHIGELSGNVFAVSTVGSILGTFLPTLYFIPVIGTRATIYIFAILLIFVGSFGIKNNKLRFGILGLLLIVAISSGNTTIVKYDSNLIFEDESAYQYIGVLEDYAGIRYLVLDDGVGIQSVYDSNRILTGMYYDYFNILPYFIDSSETKKTLIIGLAGGTIATQLNYFFEDEVELDGVEIDKKVISVAKKYFALNESTIKIHNQDGRMFLRQSDKKYDLIIVDAYQKELYIPWTLTTQEFWYLIKSRLNENGIIAINVNSTNRESNLLNTIANTITSVFDNTYITQIDRNSWNYIITASNSSLNFEALTNLISDIELQKLAVNFSNNTKSVKYNNKYIILTDNRAPIEFMTNIMGLEYFVY